MPDNYLLSNYNDLDMFHQYDGNFSIEEPADIADEFDFDMNELSSNIPHISNKIAQFRLNQTKQVNDIVSDAMKPDVEISTNDNDANVNLRSNPGFYDQVTKPAFCGLTKGFSKSINGIFTYCQNITVNHDESGFEYNRTLFFHISSSAKRIASVTVHLHHSTRNAQIQGGSSMPVNSKAAVWFMKNIVHDRIELIAHTKN